MYPSTLLRELELQMLSKAAGTKVDAGILVDAGDARVSDDAHKVL